MGGRRLNFQQFTWFIDLIGLCLQAGPRRHSSADDPDLKYVAQNLDEHGRPVDMAATPVASPMVIQNRGNWPFPERPKPPCSLLHLIMLAIHERPSKRAGLPDILEEIARRFPYYRQNTKWHKSVKCYLYHRKCFVKLPKRKEVSHAEYTLEPGEEEGFDFEELKWKVFQHMDHGLS